MSTQSPAELMTRFEALRAMVPAAEQRQMFDQPACFVNGHMFLGLHQGNVVLRLGDGERAEMIVRHMAQRFEPMPGRVMKEYVVVPDKLLASDEAMRPWVQRAFEYAAALTNKPAPSKSSKKKVAEAN